MIFLILPCIILVNVVFFFLWCSRDLKKITSKLPTILPPPICLEWNVGSASVILRRRLQENYISKAYRRNMPPEAALWVFFFVSFKEVMFVVLLTKTLKPNKWIFFHTRHLRRNVLFLRRLHSLQCNPANCLSTCSESSSAHTAVY